MKQPIEIEAGDYFYTGTVISMGNLHLVIFVEDITNINLPVIGPLLECHPLFPNRTNVEFVQALSTDEVRMKVWERGSGITPSLWDRSLCDSRSKRSARENRTKNQSRHGWRSSYHPLG